MARGSQGSEPGVWNLGGEARSNAIQLSSEVISMCEVPLMATLGSTRSQAVQPCA